MYFNSFFNWNLIFLLKEKFHRAIVKLDILYITENPLKELFYHNPELWV